ncbi:MAG: DUF2530 domain-containing protein [Mycobacteriaceae bacterium]
MSTNSLPAEKAPPELPAALRDPRPVIVAGAALWALATLAAFTIAALKDWRPVTVAGLGVSVVGVSIFIWQRSAARRGARGAQTGLE